MLYGRDVPVEWDDIDTSMVHFANLIAWAEYYDLVPSIAVQLESMVLNTRRLWKDVANFPLFYLAVGTKLRSALLFSDALRHFVGSGSTLEEIVESGVLSKSEACLALAPARECLQQRSRRVEEALRHNMLSTYTAHASRIRRKRGPEVRTTWLLSTFKPASLEGKAEWIADSILREWLDAQLWGEKFWSHVAYSQSAIRDGTVKAG